ncbi:hypothetical protein GCM10023340_08670 [Nocardioides marinquilinus]|uniref:DUF3558 domain-containing protein n=1 Tax=Nocardioides marinquilinus TaxID=1210400 RepID=A0ABP9PAI0_9ACTN
MRVLLLLAGALTCVLLSGCDGGESDADDPGSPPESRSTTAPQPEPDFATAADLLAAAEDAGVEVCAKPQVSRNASSAIDQLHCNLYAPTYVTARIYDDIVDQAYDIAGQRELAFYDQREGRPPQGVLYNQDGSPPWLLAGPLEQVRAASDDLGGVLIDMSYRENAIKPTGP